ncbi:AcvB/VirJ family lysyl-phosphatidylglycerol hydrolase [Halobellus clavatus]|uniref:Bacterial virulence domain-containing protein n=1 Tax=Halobellus clavatus TaxID=660517 RepID=A0A1H3F4Q6_9EURY|nr:AcvB/VirJ family lysyl-phosphatidylglycerol hydrolase [Halobellus clavatus]SDX85837.1 hypothetical protein SAMN04487946_103141 [Halobellus clavatus]
MTETVLLPGARDARGTLDSAGDADAVADPASSSECVVACPPHPQHGGSRTDRRLAAVSDALGEHGVDCLRFDYGAWDRGRGERQDATAAVRWARDRYDSVALFGYSFGAGVALAAAARGAVVDAVAAVAPPGRLGGEEGAVAESASMAESVQTDIPAALEAIPPAVRVGVFYGTRDDVVDVDEVVAAARADGRTVTEFDAGHRFVGRETAVASAVVAFLLDQAEDSR